MFSMAFPLLIKINIQGLKTMINYNVWFTQTTKTKMKLIVNFTSFLTTT